MSVGLRRPRTARGMLVTQQTKVLRLIGLLAAAVVFGLTLSHVLLSPGSRGLDGPTWLTIQHSFYGGFAILGGLSEVVGLAATTADALLHRRRPADAAAPMLAALCFLGTLLSYFLGNRPVNTRVEYWSAATLPADWSTYRDTWEMAHAASAVLSGIALIALLAATIWRPLTNPSSGDASRRPGT
jgi:hypothetical protein